MDTTRTQFKSVLTVLDKILGGFTVVIGLVALIGYALGYTSFLNVVLFCGLTVMNVALSQVSVKIAKTFELELFRGFVMNPVLAYLIFCYATTPFQHFAYIHISLSLGCSISIVSSQRKNFWAYLMAGSWLIHFCIAQFTAPGGSTLEMQSFISAAATMIITSIVCIELMSALSRSFSAENEAKSQLVFASRMSSLGEMAGGVAHEINTPLSIISLRIEQLEETVRSGHYSQEQILSSLKSIDTTTHRIAGIVKGLRTFALDGRTADIKDVSVVEIIENALDLCQERLSQNGIEIKKNFQASTNLKIKCRSVEISQVILNLLNNASDAISEMPEKWVKLEIKDSDKNVEISVTDSGPGIPEGIAEKIMQPFFTTKEIGKGTGLGLSISQGLIHSHNGKLLLDRKSPNTRFVILLPKARF